MFSDVMLALPVSSTKPLLLFWLGSAGHFRLACLVCVCVHAVLGVALSQELLWGLYVKMPIPRWCEQRMLQK